MKITGKVDVGVDDENKFGTDDEEEKTDGVVDVINCFTGRIVDDMNEGDGEDDRNVSFSLVMLRIAMEAFVGLLVIMAINPVDAMPDPLSLDGKDELVSIAESPLLIFNVSSSSQLRLLLISSSSELIRVSSISMWVTLC